MTTFELDGIKLRAIDRGQGPVILCLHGFPDNLHTYDSQIPDLLAAGYRVIIPELPGYSATSPLTGSYDLLSVSNLFATLITQLKTSNPETPIHLLGHDWGAGIAYTLAAQNSGEITSLTTIAIPPLKRLGQAIRQHPRQLRLSWYMFFFQLRILSDWWVKRNNFQFIERLWQQWSPDWQAPEATLSSVKNTLQQSHVLKSALAYYRQLFLPSANNRALQQLLRNKIECPALLLAGRNDGCISSELYQTAINPKDFATPPQVHILDRAGHFVHQEQPQQVNKILIHFLRSHT